MAETQNLIDLVEQYEPRGEFQPYAYYGAEEDALIFYFRGDADFARRLNSRVTVYLSLDQNELVGCQIKSVRSVLEDLGSFDVSIRHGKVNLKMLFVALHGIFGEEPDARKAYRRLGRAASETNMDVSVPSIAGCSEAI